LVTEKANLANQKLGLGPGDEAEKAAIQWMPNEIITGKNEENSIKIK
jgi:hypothetical protein